MANFKSLFKKKNISENVNNVGEKEEIDYHSEEGKQLIKEEYDLNWVIEKVEEVIDYFTQVRPDEMNLFERKRITKEQLLASVEKYIHEHIIPQSKLIYHDDLTQEYTTKIVDGFKAFVWSYDVIDVLIEDRDISDIKIYDYDKIRIKKNGERMGCDLKFKDRKQYIRFVNHIAVKNKVSISNQNALQRFDDPNTSKSSILRFNISTGFINSNELPIVHIRKTPKEKYTKEEFLNLEFFTEEQEEYLTKRIVESDGLLIAGQGGAGKTHLLNYLIDKIPQNKSGLVIQEIREVFTDIHPDMAFQHTVEAKGDNKIEYTLYDLARNGLLTDIDYFIIGEIKGKEAQYLLNAVYTGSKGWATMHGASATEAMKKLVDYIKMGAEYSQEEALKMLVHLDTVVFMEKFHIKEIAEVVGYDEKKKDLIYKMVF